MTRARVTIFEGVGMTPQQLYEKEQLARENRGDGGVPLHVQDILFISPAPVPGRDGLLTLGQSLGAWLSQGR